MSSANRNQRAGLARVILRGLVWATLIVCRASGQTPAPTILTVTIDNVVQYQENYASQANDGTSAAMEPSIGPPSTFSPGYFIGDISTINEKKTKGTVSREICS